MPNTPLTPMLSFEKVINCPSHQRWLLQLLNLPRSIWLPAPHSFYAPSQVLAEVVEPSEFRPSIHQELEYCIGVRVQSASHALLGSKIHVAWPTCMLTKPAHRQSHRQERERSGKVSYYIHSSILFHRAQTSSASGSSCSSGPGPQISRTNSFNFFLESTLPSSLDSRT